MHSALAEHFLRNAPETIQSVAGADKRHAAELEYAQSARMLNANINCSRNARPAEPTHRVWVSLAHRKRIVATKIGGRSPPGIVANQALRRHRTFLKKFEIDKPRLALFVENQILRSEIYEFVSLFSKLADQIAASHESRNGQ